MEKKGVNKQGCRIFLRLDDMEAAERNDVLRTIAKLSELAGWDKSGDMLDQSTNNVVEMPKPKGGADAAGVSDSDTGGEDVDVDAKCDPAAWKAAYVEHMVNGSELEEADAYVLANKAYESLTTKQKGNLTRRGATNAAETEMADWPEVPENQ